MTHLQISVNDVPIAIYPSWSDAEKAMTSKRFPKGEITVKPVSALVAVPAAAIDPPPKGMEPPPQTSVVPWSRHISLFTAYLCGTLTGVGLTLLVAVMIAP